VIFATKGRDLRGLKNTAYVHAVMKRTLRPGHLHICFSQKEREMAERLASLDEKSLSVLVRDLIRARFREVETGADAADHKATEQPSAAGYLCADTRAGETLVNCQCGGRRPRTKPCGFERPKLGDHASNQGKRS
jgi:hypothetical protein